MVDPFPFPFPSSRVHSGIRIREAFRGVGGGGDIVGASCIELLIGLISIGLGSR